MFENGLEKALLWNSVRDKIPELTNSRIIDHEKERFSDGCGFNYVPKLLNYICDKHGEEGSLYLIKRKNRKKYYLELFKKYYGNKHI